MAEIAIMNRNGDERIVFDTADETATAEAKALFDRLKGAGHAIYSGGETPTVLHTFDPSVERMVAVPPLAGG